MINSGILTPNIPYQVTPLRVDRKAPILRTMVDNENEPTARNAAAKRHLAATERHIFICGGKPDGKGGCCRSEVGDAAWKRVKEATAELNKELTPGAVQRTAVKCLQLCAQGPIAVVYPEGIWYRECSGENLEKVIEQHLKRGCVVEELKIPLE